MSGKTWALLAIAALAGYFAIFGGEYTVPELRALDHGVESLEEQIVVLRAQVDSLQGFAIRLESDPRTLERVARERYGMIRDGEILYRFVERRAPEGSDRSR
jgi:cell division protein FtsB